MKEIKKVIEKTLYETIDGRVFECETEAKKYEWEMFIAKKVFIIPYRNDNRTRYSIDRYTELYENEELASKAYDDMVNKEDLYIDFIFLNERFWKEEWEEWNEKR
jgi:hypothetical protein